MGLHGSDEGCLIIGDKKIALIDCGMAFCAEQKIKKIKSITNRDVDYLIVGHSHYDHIGSIPHFKRVWPSAKVVSSAHAAEVFKKPGALRTIRELSVTAANTFRNETAEYAGNYSDDELKTDIIVHENDLINLGDLTIEILETPGHTRCSLSFFIPELDLCIAGETIGVLTSETTMYPCYLVGYKMTQDSIEKCMAKGAKHIYSPHFGIIDDCIVPNYFKIARRTLIDCRDLILDGYYSGLSETEIIELFRKAYRTKAVIEKQPEKAFYLNTVVTIRTTIAECAEIRSRIEV